jgi:NAD(P)-dependent dehydrogenase (short-subunit alcohol dehydrogenase family)
MDLGLGGRSAVVTGGASGIGRETARTLAREGARLLIADQNPEGIEETLAELRDLGTEAEGLALDVRRYADCERMAALAREHFGSLDVLVTSAGVTLEAFFLQTKPGDWEPMLDVNLRGVLNSNHAVAPLMVDQRRGAIVNIASEAGKLGEKRMVVYSATKGGVIGFSKAFAAEMGRFGVRVNAVCPGVTLTPMTAGYSEEVRTRAASFYPLGRLGEPRDIASMIAFLASDQASWVTGQAISVSGGFGRS